MGNAQTAYTVAARTPVMANCALHAICGLMLNARRNPETESRYKLSLGSSFKADPRSTRASMKDGHAWKPKTRVAANPKITVAMVVLSRTRQLREATRARG